MSPKTLDALNPAYFDMVKDRMEGRERLDCLEQAAWLLEQNGPVNTLLDVGCASGYLYHYLPGLEQYHGLDNCPAYVEYGRGCFAAAGVKNAHLHCADFMARDFERDFDAAACLGLFYTFADYHEALARLLALARRVVVIRALFGPRTQIRYAPVMPGSRDFCYYNIFGCGDITEFALSRGWSPSWHADWYVVSQGGAYQTAGLDFPFRFLVLKKEPQTLAAARAQDGGRAS
jgi:SAM-dependent methyltransferase